MSPESKDHETPRIPEFNLDYISADDFFEQLTEKLTELGIAEERDMPLGQFLISGYDAAHPEATQPRTEMWAFTLDRIVENLGSSMDTPFSYIEDATQPIIAVYDPRQFTRSQDDVEFTLWRHQEDKPVSSAIVALFRP